MREDPTSESIAIEEVYPQVDCGRFPVKRALGEELEVWADVFKPGHDMIAASLEYLEAGEMTWSEVQMTLFDNDRWVGTLAPKKIGGGAYRVSAWTDRFGTALEGVQKWAKAGEDVSLEIAALARMVEEAATAAAGDEAERLSKFASRIETSGSKTALEVASDGELAALMRRLAPRHDRVSSREYGAVVDRKAASFAAWYEMFHRSQGKRAGKSATFRECEERIPDVKEMGFDVIYLPPVHPIGKTNRRGPNNTPDVGPDDPGSPWAIGSEEGGHDAVNPRLGTMADFEHFVAACEKEGIEVALDLAFQCSPDHPYVRQHPEWFYHREDGSIRYAENPPKKYFDIYPLAFDCEDWKGLWEELRRVTLFWVSKGVKTFRVDNPHTKPSGFWEWLISDVKKRHPEVLFLAEAFTAPKPMRRLSKLGFSQSYTYFTWKNTKPELEEFLREFVISDVSEYYRGNFFTNTPDILHAYLQKGGRPAFKVRLAIAATLSSLYGIYNGFELCEAAPREEGSEEYADSEKYQYKVRDWDSPGNIKDYIAKVNRIRAENAALQMTRNLRLLRAENENVLFYAKWTPDRSNVVAVAANLDPHAVQSSAVEFPAREVGLDPNARYSMKELITGSTTEWEGETASVTLDPESEPVRIYRLERGA